MWKRLVSVVWLLLFVSSMTGAQDASKKVTFEVASVRVVQNRTPPKRTISDRRVDLVSYPIRDIILMAYQLEPYRLVLPDSVRDGHPWVEISATLPAGATQAQIPEMLRALLAERFGLVAHFEPRSIDVGELTVGPSGVKMKEVEAADDRKTVYAVRTGELDPSSYDTMAGLEGQTRLVMSPDGGLRTITARTNYVRKTTGRGTTMYDATRVSMVQLVDMVSASVGKPVIDKTGLTGLYQFQLELPLPQIDAATIADGFRRAGITNRNGEPISVPPADSAPAIGSAFKAVEGLGLKLQERRAPFDVLVVDALAKTPTPN